MNSPVYLIKYKIEAERLFARNWLQVGEMLQPRLQLSNQSLAVYFISSPFCCDAGSETAKWLRSNKRIQ
jgi:hypothetical protein